MKDRIQCHDKGGKVENFKEGATTKKMKKKDEEERKRNSRQENGQTKESKRGGKESKLVTAQGQTLNIEEKNQEDQERRKESKAIDGTREAKEEKLSRVK